MCNNFLPWFLFDRPNQVLRVWAWRADSVRFQEWPLHRQRIARCVQIARPTRWLHSKIRSVSGMRQSWDYANHQQQEGHYSSGLQSLRLSRRIGIQSQTQHVHFEKSSWYVLHTNHLMGILYYLVNNFRSEPIHAGFLSDRRQAFQTQ